jgi:D-glycero-beta-D-manno-heptose 1-phosphate adenylyltransferase
MIRRLLARRASEGKRQNPSLARRANVRKEKVAWIRCMSATRQHKVADLASLMAVRESYRQAGRTLVWTNGCFDLLHTGHIRSLQAASELGDVLVVGVNSDRSVRELKGKGRPILPERDRAEILAAFECVDHVLIFDDTTPVETLQRLQPDVHCKGTEYAPPHGRPIPEKAIVESYGGRVAFLPLIPEHSTTDLIGRVRNLGAS